MVNDKVENEEKVRIISLRVLVVLGVSAVFLFVLFFLTDEIVLEQETAFDNSVFHFLDHYRTPAITRHDFFYFFRLNKFPPAGLCAAFSLFHFFQKE